MLPRDIAAHERALQKREPGQPSQPIICLHRRQDRATRICPVNCSAWLNDEAFPENAVSRAGSRRPYRRRSANALETLTSRFASERRSAAGPGEVTDSAVGRGGSRSSSEARVAMIWAAQ